MSALPLYPNPSSTGHDLPCDLDAKVHASSPDVIAWNAVEERGQRRQQQPSERSIEAFPRVLGPKCSKILLSTVKYRWKEPKTKKDMPKKREKLTRKNAMAQDLLLSRAVRASLASASWPSPDPELDETYRWWFCKNYSTISFDVAGEYWSRAFWDMGRSDETAWKTVVLYTTRKRNEVSSGYWLQYLEEHGGLLQRLQVQLSKNHWKISRSILLAIVVLAHCSLLDLNLQDTQVHLDTLKRATSGSVLEETTQEWLYLAWIDLRHALLRRVPPSLDNFVPRMYRQHLSLTVSVQRHAWDKAARNSRSCPLGSELSQTACFNLFFKLHQLYGSGPGFQTTSQPPFAQIYDLEYQLRVIHSRIPRASMLEVDATRGRMLGLFAEMLVVAIQLHCWIISRFHAPVSNRTLKALLSGACRDTNTLPIHDTVELWKSHGDLSSMLWAMATILASSLDAGLSHNTGLLATVKYLIASLGIHTLEDMQTELQKWPWVDNWHGPKIARLWSHAISSETIEHERRPGLTSHFYVGALEFYDTH